MESEPTVARVVAGHAVRHDVQPVSARPDRGSRFMSGQILLVDGGRFMPG